MVIVRLSDSQHLLPRISQTEDGSSFEREMSKKRMIAVPAEEDRSCAHQYHRHRRHYHHYGIIRNLPISFGLAALFDGRCSKERSSSNMEISIPCIVDACLSHMLTYDGTARGIVLATKYLISVSLCAAICVVLYCLYYKFALL